MAAYYSLKGKIKHSKAAYSAWTLSLKFESTYRNFMLDKGITKIRGKVEFLINEVEKTR